MGLCLYMKEIRLADVIDVILWLFENFSFNPDLAIVKNKIYFFATNTETWNLFQFKEVILFRYWKILQNFVELQLLSLIGSRGAIQFPSINWFLKVLGRDSPKFKLLDSDWHFFN